MRRRRSATLIACVVTLASAGALASPRCVRSCNQEAAVCEKTTCAGLHGNARQTCRNTCEGRAGCPAAIRTMAYVVTECRESGQNLFVRQALMVRRGDCDPVTVMEFTVPQPVLDPFGLCRVYGEFRTGDGSMITGAFQRLGVSPDGRTVVFEVTTDTDLFPILSVPRDQRGFYRVGSNGNGLRRLAPASREPAFRLVPVPGSPIGGPYELPLLPFSPERARRRLQ